MEGSPHYIVDGYNVILGRGFGGDDVAAARLRFLDLLERYVRDRRVRVTVVWDGGRGTPAGGDRRVSKVRNLFSGARSADEKIVRMVEGMENPRSVTVVSDDRRHIRGVVRNLGAQVMSVAEFLRTVGYGRTGRAAERTKGGHRRTRGAEDEGRDKEGVDDLSVDQWLDLFTINRNKRR
jgi:predicted RNA-binding protein with PIN domain